MSFVLHSVGGVWLISGKNPPPSLPDESNVMTFEVNVDQAVPSEKVEEIPEGQPGTPSPVTLSKPEHTEGITKPSPQKPALGKIADIKDTDQAAQDRESVVITPGGADPFQSFLPRPNLNGAPKFSLAPEKPQNPLLLPMANRPTTPALLPKTLRGSGGVTAQVAEDGTIRFAGPKAIKTKRLGFIGMKDLPQQDRPEADPNGKVRVGGEFSYDLTDILMRMAGQDPYSAAKRKLADDSRETRLCLAQKARYKRHHEALFELATKVRSIVNRQDLSLPAQRELVFELWDECAEVPDETMAKFAAMARATISGIIQKSFPAGSNRAYPPMELAALNQRRTSRQNFAPYEKGAETIPAAPPSSPTLCP